MSPRLLAALLALGSTTLAVADLAHAQDAKTTTTVEKKEDDGLSLPPLPADKTISQSARIGGKVITYNATVGHVPVRDAKGRPVIRVTVATTNGWKGIALSAGARQELFISTELDKQQLETCIRKVLTT